MTLQLKVADMACSACIETITKAVMEADPVAQVEADLNTKMVCIETQQSDAVKQAIANAGYHPTA